MNYVADMRAKAMKEYQDRLHKIEAMTPIFDVAVKAAKYWEELTGEVVKVYHGAFYGCTLTVHMGHLMPNGQHPSKFTELSYLREFIDEQMEGLMPFDQFSTSNDEYSTDMKWGTQFERSFNVYANHGGNCTYTQVGTRMVEQPIYELECA